MRESEGWQAPSWYTEVEREMAVAHSSPALADITCFAKVALHGPGVSVFMQSLVGATAAAQPLRVSRFDAGGPALACRLTEDQLLLLASSPRLALPQISVTALSLEANKVDDVSFVNQSCALAGFALLGPGALSTLHQLTALDLAGVLPPGSCAWTSLAGVAVLLVHGEELSVPSVRLYVSWDLAEYLWQRLLEVCKPTPVGLDAWLALWT
jgi:glycine cleavage system aminomethyltransferase T